VSQQAPTRVVLRGAFSRMFAVDVLLYLEICLVAAIVRDTKCVKDI